MTDGTWDVRIGFPKGFTVRDLHTFYEVLKESIACFDSDWFSWDVDGLDWDDISIDEIRTVFAAVESKEWDVAPDVSQLRSLICGEEGERTVDSKPDLMPCPFCGAEPRIMTGPEIWIQCPVCGASSAMSATEGNAIGKWNRRAGS